ncbi:MAG: KR domain-containing protein, partial [Oligoflexia bacterium]|nr:KR domain-containing protein [Oligoflexia bacterium]
MPDHLIEKTSNNHLTIVTNERGELTDKVVKKLLNEGKQVALLNLLDFTADKKWSDLGVAEYSFNNLNKDIFSKKILDFIHLHPKFIIENNHNIFTYYHEEKQIIKNVFLSIKHLKQLNRFITVISSDGLLGRGFYDNTYITSPFAGGLSGLIKTLSREMIHNSTYCRYLDIDYKINNNKASSIIIEELYDSNKGTLEVGRTENNERYTLEIIKENFNENEYNISNTTINQNPLFLVSGGGKGIAPYCLLKLAKSFKCRFILLGRSEYLQSLPLWINLSDNEIKEHIVEDLKNKKQDISLPTVKKIFQQMMASREIKETISKIKDLGSVAFYLQADITNNNISEKIKSIETKYGKISGIIHAAGNLSDKRIENKSAEDFEKVYSVKIDG